MPHHPLEMRMEVSCKAVTGQHLPNKGGNGNHQPVHEVLWGELDNLCVRSCFFSCFAHSATSDKSTEWDEQTCTYLRHKCSRLQDSTCRFMVIISPWLKAQWPKTKVCNTFYYYMRIDMTFFCAPFGTLWAIADIYCMQIFSMRKWRFFFLDVFCIFLLVQQDLLAAVQCQQERSQLEPRLSHTPVPPGSSLQQSGPLEQSLGPRWPMMTIEVERVSNLIHIKSLKKKSTNNSWFLHEVLCAWFQCVPSLLYLGSSSMRLPVSLGVELEGFSPHWSLSRLWLPSVATELTGDRDRNGPDYGEPLFLLRSPKDPQMIVLLLTYRKRSKKVPQKSWTWRG